MLVPPSPRPRTRPSGRTAVASAVLIAALVGCTAPLAHADERGAGAPSDVSALSSETDVLGARSAFTNGADRPVGLDLEGAAVSERVLPAFRGTVGGTDSTSSAAPAPAPATTAPAELPPAGPLDERPQLFVRLTSEFDLGPDLWLRPGETVPVGTTVVSTYHVTNVSGVTVSALGPDSAELAPGESMEIVDRSRTVTADDLAAGVVLLSGSVSGVSPEGPYTSDVAQDRLATTAERPSLDVVSTGRFHTAPGAPVEVGTLVQFSHHITNDGDVPLTFDFLPGSTLAVGASTDLVDEPVAVTAEDLAAGYVETYPAWIIDTPTDTMAMGPFDFDLPIPRTRS